MKTKKFTNYAMNKYHKDYVLAIQRQMPMYQRDNDIRSDFGRDGRNRLYGLFLW